jgi:hypothetical protein
MSLSDYSMFLKEAGVEDGPIRVEHHLLLGLAEPFELIATRLATDMSRSLRVLCYAISASLVLYATSKLIRAIRERPKE